METNNFQNLIKQFAAVVELQHLIQLKIDGVDCEANQINSKTKIKEGNKFYKVDVGSSGKYMVEVSTGNIFGIKGYGVVHRGHFYGTLETINQYYWGEYYPRKLDGSLLYQKTTPAPVLTFAPKPPNETK